MKRHFAALAISVVSPLVSTPVESIPVEVRHMFVEACFQCGGKYTEKGIKIEEEFMQYDTQEFYFALRSAYSNGMFDLVERWCVRHQQHEGKSTPVLIIVKSCMQSYE